MIIGARTAAWAKSGGWVNPYVTDGLVAMWDGEWNAGGGVHNPNATVWKNIAESNDVIDWDISFVGGVPQWGDKYARLENGCYGEGGTFAFDVHERGMTMEVVATFEDNNESSSTVGWSFYGGGNRISVGRMNASDIVVVVPWGSKALGVSGWAMNRTAVSLEAFDEYSPLTYAVNGRYTIGSDSEKNYLAWITKTSSHVIVPIGRFRVNAYTYTTEESIWKTGKMTVSSIRLYDRYLNSEELAANYAIDKARFNLPETA